MLPQKKFQLTYVELTQKHHQTGTCRADKQSHQSYYLFLLIFLLLHRLPLLHYILDQYHLEIKRMQHLNSQYSQVTIIRLKYISSFLMQKLIIPVWYIGISSPSASSRIKVPETGEVLSSSNVSLRDTRFRAEIWNDRFPKKQYLLVR